MPKGDDLCDAAIIDRSSGLVRRCNSKAKHEFVGRYALLSFPKKDCKVRLCGRHKRFADLDSVRIFHHGNYEDKAYTLYAVSPISSEKEMV